MTYTSGLIQKNFKLIYSLVYLSFILAALISVHSVVNYLHLKKKKTWNL